MRIAANVLTAVGITLNVTDLALTTYAVGVMGAVEANPLIAPFIMHPAFWAFKIVVPTLIWLYMGAQARTDKGWMAFLAVGVAVYTAIVVSNVIQIVWMAT
jgi:hypothetical protein